MRLINTVSFQLKNHSVFADTRGTQLDALGNQSNIHEVCHLCIVFDIIPSSPNLLGLDGLYNITNKFNLLGLDGIISLK